MRVRYTLTASRQIEAALDDLAGKSPQAVRGLRTRILAVASLLQAHPFAGRATSKGDIRRIFLNSYPYLIDYRVAGENVIVRRFRHSARRSSP